MNADIVVPEEKQSQLQGNRKLYYFLCISLLVALVSSLFKLFWMLDLELVQSLPKEDALQATLYAASIASGLVAINYISQSRSINRLHGPIKYFVALNIFGLLVLVINSYKLHSHVDSLTLLMLNFVAPAMISVLLAITYVSIAYSISFSDKKSFRGYHNLLNIGVYGASAFSLLIFFELPLLVFQITINIVLILILAASSERFSALDISDSKYIPRGIVFVAVLIPCMLYGKVPLQIGWMFAKFVGSTVVILLSNDEDYSLATSTAGVNELANTTIKKTPIFNDYWFINDLERLGVSANQLMRSADGGVTWSVEKDLAFYGDAIHFDQSGQRGWVGSRYWGLEVTKDGGKSWNKITPESAYKQATGKTYREGIFTTVSELHLNPETGHGSFTAKCTFYYTEDFANSWSSRSLGYDDGEKACLLDTPFSFDRTNNLALVKTMLSEKMYRYDSASDAWKSVCDLQGSEIGFDFCTEDESLSDLEKMFSSYNWHEEMLYGGTRPYGSARENIARYGSHPVTNMLKPPNQTNGKYWFADEGYLVTSIDEGASWNIEQDMRDFDHVLPVSVSTAFGWNGWGELWISRNSGSSWQRFFEDEQYLPLSFQVTHNGEFLWLLYPTKLVRIDAQSEVDTVVHSWPQPRYTQLGYSDNGSVLWAFRDGGELMTVSFDAGETWTEYQASKVQRTAKGNWAAKPILHLYCIQKNSSCFLLRSNKTVSEIALQDGKFNLVSPIAIELPDNEDDDYDYGYQSLMVSDTGQNIVAIPGSGRIAYISDDRGLTWNTSSLGSASDWRSSLAISGDGKTLAAMRDRGLSISRDFGKSWLLAKVDSDDEYEDWNYCWSPDAKTMFLYGDEYLAISTDGGSQWNEYDSEQLNEPWCGVGNGFLWLKNKDIEISAVGTPDE